VVGPDSFISQRIKREAAGDGDGSPAAEKGEAGDNIGEKCYMMMTLAHGLVG
jgi:hypothetical protein